jgi:hypothetical protein
LESTLGALPHFDTGDEGKKDTRSELEGDIFASVKAAFATSIK